MKTLQKQNLDEKSFFFSLKVPKATQSNGREGWFDERENLDQQQWAINLAVQAHEVIEPVHVYTLWSLKWQSKCPVPYQLKPGKEKEIEKMSLLWWIYRIRNTEFSIAWMYVPANRCQDFLRLQKALCSIYIWKEGHSIITKIQQKKLQA